MLPIFGICIGANSQISVVKGPVLQCFHVFVEGEVNGVFGYPYALQTWRDKATVVTGRALDCGHSPQEECPQEFLSEIRLFLDGNE